MERFRKGLGFLRRRGKGETADEMRRERS